MARLPAFMITGSYLRGGHTPRVPGYQTAGPRFKECLKSGEEGAGTGHSMLLCPVPA